MQYYLVPCALQRHVRQTMQYVVLLTRVDMHLGQSEDVYSQISVIRTLIIRNYWVIRRRRTVPTFLSIIYCNKTTNYLNFDYPKKSIFRSDSSVPIKEIAIKLPFKIRSPNVTHCDHDFFVWSSSIYTPE